MAVSDAHGECTRLAGGREGGAQMRNSCGTGRHRPYPRNGEDRSRRPSGLLRSAAETLFVSRHREGVPTARVSERFNYRARATGRLEPCLDYATDKSKRHLAGFFPPSLPEKSRGKIETRPRWRILLKCQQR